MQKYIGSGSISPRTYHSYPVSPIQAKGILGIVDYIRRNVVLCIIAAVLVTGVGSWLTSGRADTTRYVLVVDSGSTGTRIYAYTWQLHDGETLPDVAVIPPDAAPDRIPRKLGKGMYKRVETQPGLDKFIGDASGLQRQALGPLFSWARAVVPAAARRSTPMFIMGTAGMRRLPDAQRADLLADIQVAAAKSGFRFQPQWARTITGAEEGMYGWVALNYLQDLLEQPPALEDQVKAVVASGAGKHGKGAAAASASSLSEEAGRAGGAGAGAGSKVGGGSGVKYKGHRGAHQISMGALDLGGSSLELTFASRASSTGVRDDASSHTVEAHVAGSKHPLFVHSFKGYGLNDAYDRAVAMLLQQQLGHQVEHDTNDLTAPQHGAGKQQQTAAQQSQQHDQHTRQHTKAHSQKEQEQELHQQLKEQMHGQQQNVQKQQQGARPSGPPPPSKASKLTASEQAVASKQAAAQQHLTAAAALAGAAEEVRMAAAVEKAVAAAKAVATAAVTEASSVASQEYSETLPQGKAQLHAATTAAPSKEHASSQARLGLAHADAAATAIAARRLLQQLSAGPGSSRHQRRRSLAGAEDAAAVLSILEADLFSEQTLLDSSSTFDPYVSRSASMSGRLLQSASTSVLPGSAGQAPPELRHPCLFRGYNASYQRQKVNGQWPNPPVVQLLGDPDFERCLDLVKAVVNASSTACSQPPCTLGATVPELAGQFTALTGFYVVWNFLKVEAGGGVGELLPASKAYCSRSWHDVHSELGEHINHERYCLWGPYTYLLLTEGLGLKDSQLQIGAGDLGWALGVALVEGTQLPDMMQPAKHSGAGQHRWLRLGSTWVVGLVLVVALGIGLWAVVLMCTPEGGRLVRSASMRGSMSTLVPPVAAPFAARGVP